MKRFGFTDSSGILKSDQFFGVGLLLLKNIGDIGDKLYKNSQPAQEIMAKSKKQKVDSLLERGEKDEVIKILSKSRHFEMKSDNIGSFKTLPYYEGMADIFFSDPDNRFSVMVVNKLHPSFDKDGIQDAWESYTKYVALLVIQEMTKLYSDEFCLIVDEISKPQTKPLSLEDTIMSKIREEVAKDASLNFDKIFGAVSIESHSNLAMQLCDVLLGTVMYDYKKKSGIASLKTQRKKEAFASKIRALLKVNTLANQFAVDSPSYFSVSECT